MTVEVKQHAKMRSPSSAHRWLSCPISAKIAALYPNEPTEASLKGDYDHSVMDTTITFGLVPDDLDPGLDEAMQDLLAYVKRRMVEMGAGTKCYVETTMTIQETGEVGTADITLVGPREIEVIDYKSGYVPVIVRLNPQLGLYLLGAIFLHGERKKYTLTVCQPNYDHIDGMLRSAEMSEEDVEWLRHEIQYSIANEDIYAAGKHCKASYCPHRGSCASFDAYIGADLGMGWHTSELHSTDDDTLAERLDKIEELGGHRNVLRAEAMKRIMNLNRHIRGYKVVKGRKQREIKDAQKLVFAVAEHLGDDWPERLFPGLDWVGELGTIIEEARVCQHALPDQVLKSLGTPAHIEGVIKQYAKVHNLPRGGWKGVYDNVVGPYIIETHSGLTLEKAIDGRPAHRRGSEFDTLVSAPTSSGAVSII